MHTLRDVAVAVLVAALGFSPGLGWAEEEVSMTLLPIRHISVKGDAEKFRAHHWMNDGYAGGIKEFSAHHVFPSGAVFEAEGHAMAKQNDYAVELLTKKEDVGSLVFDFTQFRKWYDGTGGIYHRILDQLKVNETERDLYVDVGKFGFDGGLALGNWPDLEFGYEREYKQGAKSRLTWTAVTENGLTENIGPAWQEIDEKVDSFKLGAAQTIAGFAVSGEQRWEFVRAENLREEKYLSTSGSAADSRVRQQEQAPESNLATSTLTAERGFLDNKVFLGSAYRYAHLRSREFETLTERNAAGVLTNFASSSEQKPNNRADNKYFSHVWANNLSVTPWPWLNVITKVKAELIKQEGNSAYNADLLPTGAQTGEPDGIINRTEANIVHNRATRWGEGLAVRYTRIPKTALYAEAEFEQSRALLREDRRSVDGPDAGDGRSTTENFNRRTVTNVQRETGTLGARVSPWSFLDWTSHVRQRRYDNDYDDQQESTPTVGSTARSAFFDGQEIVTKEVATKVALKPCRWFRPAARYQYRGDKYATRAENQPIVKTAVRSHIYTLEAATQWLNDFLTTVSFSKQYAWVRTPAEYGAGRANTPTFNADVSTFLFSGDYTVRRNVTLNGSVQYSWANNFNDFTPRGLPLGADFARVDTTLGLTWALNEDTSVEAEYGFYRYDANDDAEYGDYDAHLVSLDVSKKF